MRLRAPGGDRPGFSAWRQCRLGVARLLPSGRDGRMVYPAMARDVSRLADRAAAGAPTREPFAARLHFVPRALRRPHAWLVRVLRGYFEHAPGWVIVTTRGRRTGLPREVLLPCERTADAIIVISTYHWRPDWIRNLRKDPHASVTCAGWTLPAR